MLIRSNRRLPRLRDYDSNMMVDTRRWENAKGYRHMLRSDLTTAFPPPYSSFLLLAYLLPARDVVPFVRGWVGLFEFESLLLSNRLC